MGLCAQADDSTFSLNVIPGLKGTEAFDPMEFSSAQHKMTYRVPQTHRGFQIETLSAPLVVLLDGQSCGVLPVIRIPAKAKPH